MKAMARRDPMLAAHRGIGSGSSEQPSIDVKNEIIVLVGELVTPELIEALQHPEKLKIAQSEVRKAFTNLDKWFVK